MLCSGLMKKELQSVLTVLTRRWAESAIYCGYQCLPIICTMKTVVNVHVDGFRFYFNISPVP